MSLLPKPPEHRAEQAIWQDVEFGAYAADLPLWEELADAAEAPILELGSGAGRVAMQLARAGFELIAVELDPALAAELERRTAGMDVSVLCADIADPGWTGSLDRRPGLAIAPLQVMQLLDETQRAAALTAVARALAPGAALAVALVDETTIGTKPPEPAPAPDMREVEGWVYSSEPIWVQADGRTRRIRRLRERVAPSGDLVRRLHDDVLHRLSPDQLESEAEAAGLAPAGRRTIEAGDYDAGSVAVLLEATRSS